MKNDAALRINYTETIEIGGKKIIKYLRQNIKSLPRC